MKTRRAKQTQRRQELIRHIRRAQAGKMSLVQYCRANGLAVQTLYNLRSRLARSRGRQRSAPKERKPATPFVAVRVARPPTTGPSAACRLHIKGWVIECASLPSPAWLAGLMAGDTDAVP